MSDVKPVRWGILACGNIANAFANAVNRMDSCVLHAVAARDVEKAQAFAQKHGAARAYGSYEAMLADPEVDAVYIATLHPFHLEWIAHSVQAGKHVGRRLIGQASRWRANQFVDGWRFQNGQGPKFW